MIVRSPQDERSLAMSSRILSTLAVALAATAGVIAPAATAAPPPGQADCVAQFVTDFQRLFPGFTIGDVQGRLTVSIPGYLFPTGGQAHFLQPFGELLRMQAQAAHDGCPFDLTP
jgi:hypothetical protein